MPDTIVNGWSGPNTEAFVDKEGHLHVASVMEAEIGHRSHWDATAFGGGTPLLTLTTTGGKMLWVRNNSNTHDLVISDMWFSYNGGSTNRDRCMYGSLYFGDAIPTANNTVSALGVLNRKTNNTADVTVHYWDEVGDGMTCTGGAAAFWWIQCKGHNHVDVKGAVILGVNDTMTINLQAEEIGECSVNFYGFMRGID